MVESKLATERGVLQHTCRRKGGCNGRREAGGSVATTADRGVLQWRVEGSVAIAGSWAALQWWTGWAMRCIAMAVAMVDREKCCNSRRLGCIAMVDRTGDVLRCNGRQYVAMAEGMLQWWVGRLYKKVQWDIAMCSCRPTTVNGTTPKNGSYCMCCNKSP